MAQLPPPSSVVRQAYNDIASKYDELYEGDGPLPHFYRVRLALVNRLLAGRAPADLLDVGSGAGIFGELATAMGFRYVPLDASSGMSRECRHRLGDESTPVTASVDALPLADESFDVVTALGVFEYVPSLPDALRECRRVLRPGGVLVASFLNRASPYRIVLRLRLRLKLDEDAIPPALFSRPQLLKALRQAGFRPDDVVHYDMELLPPGFAGEHPRVWKHAVRLFEPMATAVIGRLSSAILVLSSTI